MKLILSAAALWILLTPALAQQADQPVADPAQAGASAETQPAAEPTGMTQAAAQLAAQAAQSDEEQGSSEAQNSVASPTAEQLPAPMPAPEAQSQPQPGEQPEAQQPQEAQQTAAPQSEEQEEQTVPPSRDVAPPYDAGAPPQPSRQRRALAFAPALRPRAEAAAYPVYRQLQQFSVGATLLSAKEVEQKFSTPLGKHYLVVEVGVFPADAQSVPLRAENFTLGVANDDQAFFPATPEDIADALSGARPRRPSVYPNLGVGYGGGGWGRGVYTGVGVGVDPYPRRGGMEGGNHRVMENELRDKSLPEGSLTQPVAGYLYFPLSGKRSAHYNLELTRNGENISLALPAPQK